MPGWDFLFPFWADIVFAFGFVHQIRIQEATSHKGLRDGENVRGVVALNRSGPEDW